MPDQSTRIRFVVIAAASVMSVVLYLHRFCISTAEKYIQQDLGLTDAQIGWMISSFFLTYALGQVPSGWLTDRFGSRLMLTIYILLWSLLTGLMGAVGAFSALFVMRLGIGVAQAGAYPTAASIVSKWVPFQSRGKASGVIAVGGRVGGFLALSATPFVLIWMTPLSTPTAISSADILDGPLLCFELAHEPDEPTTASRLGRRLVESFPSSARTIVEAQAKRYGDARDAERQRLRAEGGNPKNAVVRIDPMPDDEISVVAKQLDDLVAQRGLFSAQDLKGIKLEKETYRLMARADGLSEQQSKRMNHLFLEGILRKSLKKLYVHGWRPMLYFYASLGLIAAAFLWWGSRNTPAEHPGCNEAEVALIEKGRPMATTGKGNVGAAPIVPLLRSVSMWLCCASQWFTNIGWLFLMTLTPRYFQEVHNASMEDLAWMTAIPPFVGWAGMLIGGFVTDRLVNVVGLRWGRALPMSLSRFVAMGAYLACLSNPSPYFAVLMFSIVAFSTDFGTTATWAFNQDVGGRHVGSVLGWGNMWGNLGAFVTPPLLFWVIGDAERWDLALTTCAIAFLLSGLCSAGVNATIPIAPEEK